jgi:hypothetical protein
MAAVRSRYARNNKTADLIQPDTTDLLVGQVVNLRPIGNRPDGD